MGRAPPFRGNEVKTAALRRRRGESTFFGPVEEIALLTVFERKSQIPSGRGKQVAGERGVRPYGEEGERREKKAGSVDTRDLRELNGRVERPYARHMERKLALPWSACRGEGGSTDKVLDVT